MGQSYIFLSGFTLPTGVTWHHRGRSPKGTTQATLPLGQGKYHPTGGIANHRVLPVIPPSRGEWLLPKTKDSGGML